ncbi:Response regulator receiver domain protein [Roseivivax jejudonensis]|uniref:Response regulator receiver domain protein n=2 Tax=Roseivivax jejudonensis TaxID=1529041 RepID=A0A1X7A2W9_9RHOB|nr:Response regulator receiver domain protein [Roseivivax jejudonensis]
MRILIVETQESLGALWQRALQRRGASVWLAHGHSEAEELIQQGDFDVIVLDVIIDGGSALALADLASFRLPSCRVVFVTDTTFFSDGTIFNYFANAAALLSTSTPTDDLVALVEHHAAADGRA